MAELKNPDGCKAAFASLSPQSSTFLYLYQLVLHVIMVQIEISLLFVMAGVASVQTNNVNSVPKKLSASFSMIRKSEYT